MLPISTKYYQSATMLAFVHRALGTLEPVEVVGDIPVSILACGSLCTFMQVG